MMKRPNPFMFLHNKRNANRKTEVEYFKISVKKPGTNKSWFTIRCIMFNPRVSFIDVDEAKEFFRKKDKISKKKMSEEYGVIFAARCKAGRGDKAHIEFSKAPKIKANSIFIIPNKWRIEASKYIENYELWLENK